MAERRVIVGFGSSNWEGLLSKLLEVPVADYDRVYGVPLLTQFQQQPTGYPFTQTVPGVKMWTPKLPYSDNIARVITVGSAAAGTTLTYTGAASGAEADSWVFISLNATGQGNIAKVVSDNGSVLTIAAPGWTLPVAADGALVLGIPRAGQVTFLRDSHTFDSLSADGFTVTKTTATDDFGAEVDGKFVLFFSPNGANGIRRVVSHGTDTLVLDDRLTAAPTAASGFVVLTGATAAQSLATFATGAAFRELQLHLNTAPCFLTGFDYCNHNLQSPAAPTFSLEHPINCMPELMWQFRSRFAEDIYGVSIGIDSAKLAPRQIDNFLRPLYFSWLHDVEHLDFHPNSPNSLYTALTTALDSITALLAAQSDTPKFEFFTLIFDNEGLDSTGTTVSRIADNARLLRQALRDHVNDQRAKFIMVGMTADGYGFRPQTYHLLRQVRDEDTFTGLVDTRTDDYALSPIDNLHLTTVSQIHLGKDCFKVWASVPDPAVVQEKEVEVANLALAHIGNKARVESLFPSDGSPEADYCALYLPKSVKAVLGMHAWGFALEKRDLEVVNEDELDTDNPAYAFRYAIPLNCVTALKIIPEDATNDDLIGGAKVPIDFKRLRSAVDGVERIYTNLPNAHLRYVAHERDLSRWDELAIFALSWHVASLLAGSLIKSETGHAVANQCLQRMGQYLAEAKSKDSNERQVTLDRPAAQIQARR